MPTNVFVKASVSQLQKMAKNGVLHVCGFTDAVKAIGVLRLHADSSSNKLHVISSDNKAEF